MTGRHQLTDPPPAVRLSLCVCLSVSVCALRAPALLHHYILPVGDAQLALGVVVRDRQRAQFARRAAGRVRVRHVLTALFVFLVDPALQEGVVVCHVVGSRTAAAAVVCLERGRRHDLLEAAQLLEVDLHLLAAALLVLAVGAVHRAAAAHRLRLVQEVGRVAPDAARPALAQQQSRRRPRQPPAAAPTAQLHPQRLVGPRAPLLRRLADVEADPAGGIRQRPNCQSAAAAPADAVKRQPRWTSPAPAAGTADPQSQRAAADVLLRGVRGVLQRERRPEDLLPVPRPGAAAATRDQPTCRARRAVVSDMAWRRRQTRHGRGKTACLVL